jgi:hypothetical protein
MCSSTISSIHFIVANYKLRRIYYYEGPSFCNLLSMLRNRDYLNDILVLGGVTIKKIYFRYTSSYVRPE